MRVSLTIADSQQEHRGLQNEPQTPGPRETRQHVVKETSQRITGPDKPSNPIPEPGRENS